MFLLCFVALLTVNSVVSAPTTTIPLISEDTSTAQNTLEKSTTTNEQTFDFSALKTLGDDYKKVATLGLLAGTLKTEQEMEMHITKLATDLFNSDNLTPEETLKKVVELEKLMERDNKAISILNSALDLAQNEQPGDYEDYKRKLRTIVNTDNHPLFNIKSKLSRPYANYNVESDSLTQLHKDLVAKVGNIKSGIGSTIGNVKSGITQHVKNIHSSVSDKASKTIKFLTGGGSGGGGGTVTKAPKGNIFNKDFITNILSKNTQSYNSEIPDSSVINIKVKPWSNSLQFPTDWNDALISPITPANAYLPVELKESDKYVVSTLRRQDDETDKETDTGNDIESDKDNEIESDNNAEESKEEKSSEKETKEEDESSESEESSEEMPGGLVGLIASLSGGDEGSDIPALIAALSGVISNLFGPGGLDIPSLLSTGTSLIAALLGGEENFGKVLGGYVGTAVDGLSGGGGADNNGLFFGNLVGSLIAQLSANPEDEDLPPSPKIFLENFFTGFHQPLNRKTDAEPVTEKPEKSGSSSDILGFISNIVASIVGGIASTILNASLGSSSGSSQGSAELSGGSSAASSASHPQ